MRAEDRHIKYFAVCMSANAVQVKQLSHMMAEKLSTTFNAIYSRTHADTVSYVLRCGPSVKVATHRHIDTRTHTSTEFCPIINKIAGAL